MTTGTELGRPIEICSWKSWTPGDVDLTREGLADGKLRNHLHVAGDGEEAMAFLRRAEEHADMPMPDLILLDLNLPGKDVREVLTEIKADERLGHIPVVVLTSSQDEEDILQELAAARQLLHLQADPVRRVRQGRQVHRGTLVHDRHPSRDPSEPRRRLSRARGIERGGGRPSVRRWSYGGFRSLGSRPLTSASGRAGGMLESDLTKPEGAAKRCRTSNSVERILSHVLGERPVLGNKPVASR